MDRVSHAEYYPPMTKVEILEELQKLTPEERHEIRLELAELAGDGWMDADDPLTGEEKELLEARLADIEKHPEKSIPWEEAKRRIEARFGK
jgi:putative addiction module component (TIGR02574 family)